MQLTRWAHVHCHVPLWCQPATLCSLELSLLHLHTRGPDGADARGLQWPCVDEVTLLPSPSGWDQEGPDTAKPLSQGLERRDRTCFDAVGGWNLKVLERWGKARHGGSPGTVQSEIRESRSRARRRKESRTEKQEEELGAGERSGAVSSHRPRAQLYFLQLSG